jgi:hypothetical protein
MLEGYFSVHNFSNRENITFVLLKVVPHVKNWWETYCEKNSTEESGMFEVEPTWDFFMDVIKEQYYPVGNYDNQYMRWTTLHQERGPNSVRVHKYLPYLAHQAGYQRL